MTLLLHRIVHGIRTPAGDYVIAYSLLDKPQ